MFILEVIFAACISLLLRGLFVLVTRNRSGKTGSLRLFLIIFLATWAGGIWLKPFGPSLWGIHWLGFLVAGLFVLIILVITTPNRAPKGRRETLDILEKVARNRELDQITYLTLGVFFWILLAFLIIAIISRYIL
jgi:hypothetical protein